MNKKNVWTLINNNSHKCFDFSSERKLKGWAKERGLIINRSYLDQCCFYTDSTVCIPGEVVDRKNRGMGGHYG